MLQKSFKALSGKKDKMKYKLKPSDICKERNYML